MSNVLPVAPAIEAYAVGPTESPLTLQVVAGTGTGAAVVVVPSVFGLRDDVLDLLRRLAPHTRRAVAFDTFNRVDAGVLGRPLSAAVVGLHRLRRRPRVGRG